MASSEKTETTEPASRREVALGIAAILATIAVSVWLRWPGFTQGGFASHDVAGILYNAMVLRDGELPYVADIELKSPGSFYLAWALGTDGTDIARLQVWANLWAVFGIVAVAAIAWRQFGARAAVCAAVLVALCDAHLDSMDANYVTWSQLPQVLAFGWAAAAARHRGITRTVGMVIAGVLVGLTVMIKQPTGAVALALVLAVLPGGWSDRWWQTRRDWLALVLGGVASHLPLVLHYAAHGAVGALIESYPINRWGIGYVGGGGREAAHALPIEGALATVYFLALPLVLAAFAVWRREPTPSRGASLRLPLVAWALCMIAAAWVGGRFYKGYFLGALPPLALLAAAPWGLLGAVATSAPGLARNAARWSRAVLLVPIVVLLARQVELDRAGRIDRARPHDEGARVVAGHLLRELPDEARIWIWGWHLWDLYPMTNRRSASRVYKSLGLLTPPNDDTWRLPATPLVFVGGEHAEMIIEDLERDPPGYVVLGSTVPQRQFTALRQLLARDYKRDTKVRLGKLEMWRHRSLGPPQR